MRNSPPLIVPALILIAAVTLVHVANLAFAPDVLPVEAGAALGGPVATPSHDPQRVGFLQGPTVATPETTGSVKTPHHHPDPVVAISSFAVTPATLRAEPATQSDPTFVAADVQLYAKDHARLRAAPSTSADVLTKLVADAPLRATARSTDRAWWRVWLAGGRSGYVHQTAVTKHRMVKTQPKAAPSAPVVAVAASQPEPAPASQGLLGYVDETMTWLADAASQGSAPPAIRTER